MANGTGRKGKKRTPRYLIVRNLHHSAVGFRHPEEDLEVNIPGYGAVALDPEKWDDVPDLDRLVEYGLLSVYPGDRRPRPLPLLPPELEPTELLARSTVRQIAFHNDEDTAAMLINVRPLRAMPNMTQNEPDLDVEYLKGTHRKVLKAALWFLEHVDLPWSKERAEVIRERIEFIEKLSA